MWTIFYLQIDTKLVQLIGASYRNRFFEILISSIFNPILNLEKIVCTSCCNRFFEFLIFSIFRPVLDYEKVAFIMLYEPKCLCGLYLSYKCYQKLYTGLFGDIYNYLIPQLFFFSNS